MKAMLDLVARHKSGSACGIYSVCSAHPLVLEAYERGALPLKPGRSPRAFELSVLRFLEAAQEAAR